MNRILSAVFGLIFAVTANAALNPIKYTDYPHTNVFGLFDLFLFAKTNVALPTNYTIIGYEIINQLSNAIPTSSTNFYTTNTIINTNMSGGSESLWTNQNGIVSLILGDTNSLKVMTNGRQGIIIGDTNRAFSFFGWPANDLTYINVRDGSPGHTVNQIFPVAAVDSTGSGAYEGFYTQSGSNPIFSHSSVAVTNAVVATQLDEVAQKGGGYILLRDVGATNFVGIQNAGQLSTAIGPNHIRIFSHGGEKLILSTNGNVSFFGSATNYGVLYARSNFVVLGTALFNDPVVISDGALILQGLVTQGITNTIGFQTLGRISLGNSASDLTTSYNTLRQYGPTYLENAALTSNRVLYLDSGRLVATATFAPGEVSTIAGLMNASNILSGLIGTPNLWTNDSDLSIVRLSAGSTNFIGGGTQNTISSNTAYATIAGGTTNAIGTNSSNSAIGGGTANTASFPNTTIAGGYGNTAAGTNSTVGGGYGNRTLASGTASGGSIIAGGVENLTADQFVTIGGGKSNSSYSPFSYIGGGGTNTIFGATDEGSETIGGGSGHSIIGAQFATIGGGAGNIINSAALASTIAGGSSNVIQSGVAPNASPNSFIGGGYSNTVVYPGPFNAIGGGLQNTLKATHGFVGGGYLNVIQTNATYSTIGGGRQNNIGTNSGSTTIGGGENNAIGTSSIYTTIAGGLNNTIQRGANGGTILGGNGNTIQQDSQQTVIVGGANNSIGSNSIYSAILGGAINTIKTNTPYAFVIGNQVTASNASSLEVRFTNTAGVVIDTANLHLADNMKIKMTNGAASGAVLTSDANGVLTLQSFGGGGGGGGAGSGTFINSSNGFGTNATFYGTLVVNTNVLVVTNGNIGIGTSDPQKRVHILNSGSVSSPADFGTVTDVVIQDSTSAGSQAALTIIAGTTGQSSIRLGDTADYNPGNIIYDHADNSLRIGVSSGERARITSGGNLGVGTTTPTSGRLVIDGGALTFGTDNTYDIGASGANRPRSGYFGTTLTSPAANIRTNLGTMDVTTNLFVLGTRVTNATRRIFVGASAQLNAAAAGTAKITLYVENAGSATNRLSVSAGPLASLTTVEALFMAVSPGSIYYFADETSGAGATAALVPETCSVTAF